MFVRKWSGYSHEGKVGMEQIYLFHPSAPVGADTLPLGANKIMPRSLLQGIWLEYIDGQEATDDFTRELEQAVQSVRRNEKRRLDYMMLEQEYRERYNEGLEEGQVQDIVKNLKRTAEM